MKRVAALLFVVLLAATGVYAGDAELLGKVSPDIINKLSKGDAPMPVIVLLWSQEVTNPDLDAEKFDKSIDAFDAESERTVRDVIDKAGILESNVQRRYTSFPAFAATISSSELTRLVDHPYVRMIIPDAPINPKRKEGNALMNQPAMRTRGFGGNGVSVAVIDDGVDYNHPELGGARFPNSVVIAGWDFKYNVSDPSPIGSDTHGTAVSAIIAGRGDPQTGATGVAPMAKIVGLRTFGSDFGSTQTLLAAIDWVVNNKTTVNPPIGVVNMSIGIDDLGFYTSNCDNQPNATVFRDAFARLTQRGIAAVVSTGNENKTNSTSIPSCLSQAISAGAVYDANIGGAYFSNCSDVSTAADMVTCYSNSASFVSLLAPSHDCRTARAAGAGGGYEDDFGGTSAAAPYISGSIAMLMSAAPGKTPAQYRDALRSTGRMILDPKAGVSIPRVNIDAAYQAMAGGGGGGTKPYNYFLGAAAHAQGNGGTFFQTDLRVFNTGNQTATVDAYFLPGGADNTNASPHTFNVASGTVAAYNDMVLSLLNLPVAAGAVRFASTQPLVITSDTYTLNNVCPEHGGTLGQYIPGFDKSKAATQQVLFNVIGNTKYRSNIGIVNTTTTGAAVSVKIYDGATGGLIAQKNDITLSPYGWTQLNGIFQITGAPASDNAVVLVTATQPIISYVSVVDNFTGDPIYVPGQ